MTHTRRGLAALMSGALFGAGLAVSQMINPNKILDFLDFMGSWDPSLGLVMIAGLAVTLMSFRWLLHVPGPLLDIHLHLPTKEELDSELILGALIFGVGWGLAGYCPGPAIAAIALGTAEPMIFTAAVIAGFLLHRFVKND